MTKIIPFSFWLNGLICEARFFVLSCAGDNLTSFARFNYELLNEAGNRLVTGSLVMDGEDYDQYTNNDWPYVWAAKRLGLTIDETKK